MKIFLKKHLNSLIPADSESEEMLRKIKSGVPVSCELKRPRNYENHKRYFAMLKIAFENQIMFGSIGELREAVAIEAGHTRLIKLVDGSYQKVARSISFGSMNEDQFQDLFSRSIDVIIKYVLPRISREDFIQEILAFA